MALVLFRNSEPNRVYLKTSQNKTHRGQFGHFALTLYKHFALHKSREDSHNFNSPKVQKHFLSILSQFSWIKTTNYIKLSSKTHQSSSRSRTWIEESRSKFEFLFLSPHRFARHSL